MAPLFQKRGMVFEVEIVDTVPGLCQCLAVLVSDSGLLPDDAACEHSEERVQVAER